MFHRCNKSRIVILQLESSRNNIN